MEPRYNQPLYNEDPTVTNDIVKCLEKNPDIMNSRYNKYILPVPWHFASASLYRGYAVSGNGSRLLRLSIPGENETRERS